jgi:hypothetical protein
MNCGLRSHSRLPTFGLRVGFRHMRRTQNRIMVDKVDIRWTVTVDVHRTDHGTVVSFVPLVSLT